MSQFNKWLTKVRFLTCAEASRLMSKSMDAPLSRKESVALTIHQSLCGLCRRYARQVRALRAWVRKFEGSAEMPAEMRERLKARLR